MSTTSITRPVAYPGLATIAENIVAAASLREDLTLDDIAERAGIAPQRLSEAIARRDISKMNVSDLGMIAMALGVSASELATPGAFDPEEEELPPLPSKPELAHHLGRVIIGEQRGALRISRKHLARATGISYPRLSRCLRGEEDLTVAELDRITTELGMPAHELLRRAQDRHNR